MTRVDFYLLNGADDGGKHLAACKLIHKVFRLGHRVYLLTETADEAGALDQLLWTFAAGSFIPHQRLAAAIDPRIPVVIGNDAPPEAFNDVMVSLAHDVPPYYDRFQRVAEIVGGDDTEKQRARERFRFYRERGCPLETHTL